MQTFTLKIKDIQAFNSIKEALSKHEPLSNGQQNQLINLLANLLPADKYLSDKIPTNELFEVKVWDIDRIEKQLEKWKDIFHNLPGYDYCPFCYLVDQDNTDLLRKNIVIVAVFAPSFTYNEERDAGFEVHLKDDGTATFWLPTLEDGEKYPELYSFKGSWKEAYLLLIATLQKGWPMEEFPEELQKFLPKQ